MGCLMRFCRHVMRRYPKLKRWRRYWFRPAFEISGVILRAVCLADLIVTDDYLAHNLRNCSQEESIRQTKMD
jgi:hypothetical protein